MRVRVGRTIIVLLSAVALTTACAADPEFAILIDAFPPDDQALATDTDVRITVRDLRSTTSVESQRIQLGRDIDTAHSMRIGIELHAAGQMMVHVVAASDAGAYAATRCYEVTGVTRSDVLLEPLEGLDGDGDGWAASAECHERGASAPGCRDACPVETADDCDDADPDRNPGAGEVCDDGVDQDCDGDEPHCEDGDGDLYPPCSPDAPAGSGCDCDDSDPEVHPGVHEDEALCENARDDDCDGEDQLCDRDGDGARRCRDEADTGCDCRDDDPGIHPSATETPDDTCDGEDNNCNGLIDEVDVCLSADLDGDGAPADCSLLEDPEPSCVGDCNDCSSAMTPGRDEVCGDRIDEACGLGGGDDGGRLDVGVDACDEGDLDGDGSLGVGGADCDDDEPRAHPGALDQCEDGVDWDCSGQDSTCDSDEDGDGFNQDNDCNDRDPEVHPGATDDCDGIDDDCDGVIDEDVPEGFGCVNVGTWTEVDFASDLQHCGHCRNGCNQGCDGRLCRADGCEDGRCLCGSGEACAGSDDDFCCLEGCTDITSDPRNCGTCGAQCEAPECVEATCDGGTCGQRPASDGMACSGGRTCCDGACVGACAPGDTDTRPCGRCGLQTRTCGDDCQWGNFGGCSGEGVCTAGEVQSLACGNCGTQLRSCDETCNWGSFGACAGEGVCSPASPNRQVSCGDCGSQEQDCTNACQWVNVGSCDNTPPRSCDDLNTCTTDSCGSTGLCAHTGCGAGVCCSGACAECCDADPVTCTGNPPGTCRVWSCDGTDSCVPVNAPNGTDPYRECGQHGGSDCCNGSGGCRRNAGGESC